MVHVYYLFINLYSLPLYSHKEKKKKKEKLQSAVGFEPRTYSQVTSEKKKKKPRVVFEPAATKKKKKKKATSGVWTRTR